jgi:hypothetical protein
VLLSQCGRLRLEPHHTIRRTLAATAWPRVGGASRESALGGMRNRTAVAPIQAALLIDVKAAALIRS